MTKNFRLKIARQKSGFSQSQLAEKLDVTQPYIAKLEKNDDFSESQAQKIAEILGVEADWLMNGDENDQSNVKDAVPYYDSDVTGSIVGSFHNIPEKPVFFIDFKPFNDCDAYFTIAGDSMYPKYQAGEILAVKQVKNLEMIQWGESYLVIGDASTDNIRTVKNLHPHDKDESKMIMRASNPNFKGDTPIRKDAILSMYLIKGKIKKEQL